MGDPGPEAGVMAAMTQEFLVEPQPSHKYKCVPVVDGVHSVQDHGHTLSSVSLADTSLLSTLFQEAQVAPLAGQVDTLMVDTDAIYSVLSPAAAAAYTQLHTFTVPDMSAVAVAAVPELYTLPAPEPSQQDSVSSVTVTLPEPVVTSDEYRLEILGRTWTPHLPALLAAADTHDVTISCAGAEAGPLSAHKIMLAAASPFLARCLETVDTAEDAVSLILPDFSYLDVKEFLDVLYLDMNEDTRDGFCRLSQYLSHIDNNQNDVCDPHDYVKYEEKIKKMPIEIKMESSLENSDVLKKLTPEKITEITLDDNPTTNINIGDQFKCEQCEKTFKQKASLIKHQKIHGEPKFQCTTEECDKKFHLKDNLIAHQENVHLKSKTIPCNVCGKMFYNKSLLRSHMQQHEDTKHVCEHCSNEFSCSKSLKEHIKFKHDNAESLLICTVCHKSYSTPQNLKSHFSRVHMQERKHVCPKCGKCFFEKAELENHLSSHSSETLNIECDVCKLKFKNKKTLYYHQKRTHNPGNKIHICYQCGKSYADSHHLNRHILTHGQKSCTCKICGKSFQSDQKVKAHVRKVHEKWRKSNEPSKQCMLCNKTFTCFNHMRRHLKDFHKLSQIEANSALIENFNLDPKKHKMNPNEIVPELL